MPSHNTPQNFHYFVGLTAQKMKFSIKDFFSKCDQIRSFLFCGVQDTRGLRVLILHHTIKIHLNLVRESEGCPVGTIITQKVFVITIKTLKLI